MFKWLLLFLLLATPAWAQNPTCPTRSVGDSTNACASTAFVQNQIAVIPPPAGLVPSVLNFGAVCDGVTNDTAAIQSAINSGGPITLPAGKTCMISTVNLIGSLKLYGLGPGATLQRIPSAATGSMLNSNATNGFTLENFTVDGNASNETNSGNGIGIVNSGNFIIRGVSSNNHKIVGGVNGSGFVIQDTTDGASNTSSLMNNVTGIGNQGPSILINYTTGTVNNLTIDGFYSHGPAGGGMGLISSFTVGTNNKIANLKLTNFTVDCNASGLSSNIQGVSLPGYVQATGSLGPVYNFAFEAVWNAQISHGMIINCPSYGMLAQIAYSSITDVHTYNSGTWSFTGGFVLNAYRLEFIGNTVDWDGQYGVDAGGCTYCVVSNNTIAATSVASPPNNSVGLNIGGGFNAIAADNLIAPAASSSSFGITAEAYEADGSNIGFPWQGAGLVLDHNRIVCVGAGGCSGIAMYDGGTAQLSGNSVLTTTNNLAYQLDSNFISWGAKNTLPAGGLQADADAVTAATQMSIPDDPKTLYITGTTTINNILTYDQARIGAGVAYVTLTAGGSSYTSAPSVAFTGGTCSTQPTAIALLAGNGVVAGIRLTGTGVCTVGPTGVSITGGGGSGATATLQFELTGLASGRQITLVPTSGGLTLTNNSGGIGSIFNVSSSNRSLGNNAPYSYTNITGSWSQTQ